MEYRVFSKEKYISQEENIALIVHDCVKNEDEHKHEFFEFVYIKDGFGTHKIDDVEYNVKHGDLLFINKNQVHSYTSNVGMNMLEILINSEFISNELIDSESILLLFRDSMFAEFSVEEIPQNQGISFRGDELKEVDNLISLMIREYNKKEIGYKSVMHGVVRILFSKLLRGVLAKYEDISEEKNELIEKSLEYIEDNYNQKILLSDIATQAFYNPIYFGKIFKDYCGQSFSDYLKEKRMFKAAELMKTTELSIEDIMYRVGYSDKKSFWKYFKDIYGETPNEFRKKI